MPPDLLATFYGGFWFLFQANPWVSFSFSYRMPWPPLKALRFSFPFSIRNIFFPTRSLSLSSLKNNYFLVRLAQACLDSSVSPPIYIRWKWCYASNPHLLAPKITSWFLALYWPVLEGTAVTVHCVHLFYEPVLYVFKSQTSAGHSTPLWLGRWFGSMHRNYARRKVDCDGTQFVLTLQAG